jgi:hypothetical protein
MNVNFVYKYGDNLGPALCFLKSILIRDPLLLSALPYYDSIFGVNAW